MRYSLIKIIFESKTQSGCIILKKHKAKPFLKKLSKNHIYYNKRYKLEDNDLKVTIEQCQ